MVSKWKRSVPPLQNDAAPPGNQAGLFVVVRKPLARRVVPKKTIVDNEGRKTPFAIIDARSGNCTKEAKGGHSEWTTWIVYRTPVGIANTISCLHRNIEGKCFSGKRKGDGRDIKNTVQLEKGEDHRSRSVSRSYPHVGGDPTEVFCIKLYGIPEGNEQFDAVRKISGAKI